MFAWENGYHAGLSNDTANPYPFWQPLESLAWRLGNEIGHAIYCRTVEAIYLRFECNEGTYV